MGTYAFLASTTGRAEARCASIDVQTIARLGDTSRLACTEHLNNRERKSTGRRHTRVVVIIIIIILTLLLHLFFFSTSQWGERIIEQTHSTLAYSQ